MEVKTFYLSIDRKTEIPEEKAFFILRRFFDGNKLVKETFGIKRNDSV
ncbi:hypothetical protein [Sporolactobacillus laevolacticus]|uniref:Uncharacterized protein n=1 Tax=Sporolactobacillus laevolacticus DSM 442 TaxID=1395513 RepID=V6J600_9BACL|nr:hypothetical protein [Sporolactobacillus laevolacticus]EST12184.1 hypothetical protein P343_07645 [Sporolactobacillus laevolacticus DSM 442]